MGDDDDPFAGTLLFASNVGTLRAHNAIAIAARRPKRIIAISVVRGNAGGISACDVPI